MPLKLHATVPFDALPDVLVFDFVGVLRSHLDSPLAKCIAALFAPDLELSAMRLVFDAGYHEIAEMTELVCDNVEEAMLVVDDFRGKLDGSEMLVCDCRLRGRGTASLRGFSSPVRTASSRVESLGPDEFDSACGSGKLLDLAFRYDLVELLKEILGER